MFEYVICEKRKKEKKKKNKENNNRSHFQLLTFLHVAKRFGSANFNSAFQKL